MMEVSLLSHLTNSALVVYGLKWLRGTQKYQKCAAWLPVKDGTVHRLVSLLGASLSAIGMGWAVEGSSDAGYKFTLMIPPLLVLMHTLWGIALQFALNQLLFAIAVQEKAAAPVVTVPLPHEKDVTITAAIPKETGV